jgi:hypothetical protein
MNYAMATAACSASKIHFLHLLADFFQTKKGPNTNTFTCCVGPDILLSFLMSTKAFPKLFNIDLEILTYLYYTMLIIATNKERPHI